MGFRLKALWTYWDRRGILRVVVWGLISVGGYFFNKTDSI